MSARDPRVEAAAAALWEQRPMMRTADGAPRPWAEVPAWSYGARYRGQAQVALAAADAADPHRPRTITTAEELDALPEGSVVLEADTKPFLGIETIPGVFHKFPKGLGWHVVAGHGPREATKIGFPATVLYAPEAAA